MSTIKVDVVSAEEQIFSGDAEFVALPGESGELGILPQHAPIVSSLTQGKLTYVTADGTSKDLEIAGGFVEMNDNNVSVCIN